MKKKLSAIVLALVLALSLLPAAAFAADDDVAQVGENSYATLAEAIDAAKDGGTVKLLKDVEESVTIPANATVTLDLNGKTLTNSGAANTITVAKDATLVISGEGTVDNVNHGESTIYNMGTVTLNGGTYERSAEKGTESGSNGNSYYTILNHGAMEVNEGVVVKNAGSFSSLFENGYYDATKTLDGIENPVLTIKGGKFDGGLNTIKNDDNAKLTIENGEFTNYTQACVQNHNEATINGGSFIAEGAKWVVLSCGACGNNAKHDVHSMTINGGDFVGNLRIDSFAELDIKGGHFSDKNAIDYTSAKAMAEFQALDHNKNEVTVYGFYDSIEAAQEDELIGGGATYSVINTTDPTTTLTLMDGDEKIASFVVPAGYELTFGSLEMDYLVFMGWSDGTKVYQAGDKYEVVNVEAGNDGVVFNAKWGATVSYDYGYENKSEEKVVALGETIKLPEASREGYTFKGWVDSEKQYQAGDEYTVTKAVTFEAQWEAVKDTTPTTPTTPTNPSAPNTGVAGVSLWVCLLAVAGMALVVTLVAGNQKHGRREAK